MCRTTRVHSSSGIPFLRAEATETIALQYFRDALMVWCVGTGPTLPLLRVYYDSNVSVFDEPDFDQGLLWPSFNPRLVEKDLHDSPICSSAQVLIQNTESALKSDFHLGDTSVGSCNHAINFADETFFGLVDISQQAVADRQSRVAV
jgi:hypothetical protein